jgi:hypothetical protein
MIINQGGNRVMLQRYLTALIQKKIQNDLSSNYEEDRSRNPMVRMSPFFRLSSYLMFALGLCVLGICMFTPSLYVIEGIDPENIPVFMYVVSILLLVFSLRMMCYKVTLEKDTLVIRRFLRNQRISLDELRLGAMSIPPKKVRSNHIVFATNTGKKVRVMYVYALGGVAFIKMICNRIHAPFPQSFHSISQNASLVLPKE